MGLKLKAMGCNFGGSKLARLLYRGVYQVDLYFATPETWATLLLIRTGSTANNVHLCSIAKARGWKLKADGQGLFNEKGDLVASHSEEEIFEALGLKYLPPEKRE